MASIIILVIGWTQGLTVNRIFYTENTVFTQDILTVQEIKSQIDGLGMGELPDEPVVFVGNHYSLCNKGCLNRKQLGLTGRSVLEMGFSMEHSTFVKIEFIDATLGVHYKLPTKSQMSQADELATTMPSWPSEGSVVSQDGVIVVKLS